jgi:uncharacterized protein (DUF1015 family)
VNVEEARNRAAVSAWNFLHVSRPEVDLPAGVSPYDPAVYAKAKENFVRMVTEGVLQQDRKRCYYVYRLTMGAHVQTGLVTTASVAAYLGNRIRKHELTHPDKEEDRARHIDALNAQTGPVALTYRQSAPIDALVQAAARGQPDVDVIADGNVRHSLWVVRERARIDALTVAFDALDALYIADGHHRTAAAARVASTRRLANPAHRGDEACNYFLAVLFPDAQMQILDYNRVVRDLNGLTVNQFVDKLQDAFLVDVARMPVKPAKTSEFGMYLDGEWYQLRIKSERVPSNPVGRLDVSLLAEHLLAPILGLTDVRRDERIEFVGGIRGLRELERRVDSGEMAVAFSLYPTSLKDLMAVADAGAVMPPKSTWFEPKLADGLVSHIFG